MSRIGRVPRFEGDRVLSTLARVAWSRAGLFVHIDAITIRASGCIPFQFPVPCSIPCSLFPPTLFRDGSNTVHGIFPRNLQSPYPAWAWLVDSLVFFEANDVTVHPAVVSVAKFQISDFGQRLEAILNAHGGFPERATGGAN